MASEEELAHLRMQSNDYVPEAEVNHLCLLCNLALDTDIITTREISLACCNQATLSSHSMLRQMMFTARRQGHVAFVLHMILLR